MLGRKIIFDDEHSTLSDFSEEQKNIWIHFVDTYVIPTNKEIIQILQQNRHLLNEADDYEKYIKPFIDYAVGWELLDNQKRNGVKNYYEYHYAYAFPKLFTEYFSSTLNYLSEEQASIIKRQKPSK